MKNIFLLGGLAALLFLSKKATANNSAGSEAAPAAGAAGFPNWGDPSAPRGVRNNNAGNLKFFNIGWKGEIIPSQDPIFSQFTTPAYGVRALIKDIKNDINLKCADTIEKLIYTYAPPNENNTENYIDVLAQMSGYSRYTPLFATKETLKRLAQSIANFENYGIKPLNHTINEALFNEAYNMI